MKYFTKELWEAVNSRDRADRAKANQTWDKNLERYHESFASLRPSLPMAAQRFFGRTSLHDGLLLACAVGDGIDFVAKSFRLNRRSQVQAICA